MKINNTNLNKVFKLKLNYNKKSLFSSSVIDLSLDKKVFFSNDINSNRTDEALKFMLLEMCFNYQDIKEYDEFKNFIKNNYSSEFVIDFQPFENILKQFGLNVNILENRRREFDFIIQKE